MTYDDVQFNAILVTCSACGKKYFMTHPQAICQRCREKKA